MSVTGARIVSEARTWIGTPWHHQARKKGFGVDCAGVVIGTAAALGLAPEFVDDPRYSRDPDGNMQRVLQTHLLQVPWNQSRQGDVIHIAWAGIPQHIGVLTDAGKLVHAFGPAGVVETYIAGRLSRGVRGVYRFKEVA